MDDKNNDRPALESEIEVTPEMVEAGVMALSVWHPVEDSKTWVVEDIFEAMMRARAGSRAKGGVEA